MASCWTTAQMKMKTTMTHLKHVLTVYASMNHRIRLPRETWWTSLMDLLSKLM